MEEEKERTEQIVEMASQKTSIVEEETKNE
jgi:hypothetical protein